MVRSSIFYLRQEQAVTVRILYLIYLLNTCIGDLDNEQMNCQKNFSMYSQLTTGFNRPFCCLLVNKNGLNTDGEGGFHV